MRTWPSRSPTAATSCPQGGSSSKDPRRSCSSTRISERPTLAVSTETLPARCRHRFPIFGQRIYINSCAQGALSDAVRGSYEQYLRDWDEYGAPWEYWVERGEAARASFADLIGASPDEVAVTTSESAGVASLASGLRFARRSKVVLTDWEFPTIGQIWHAQEARGARVVHVPPAADRTIFEMDHTDSSPAPTASRFQSGTPPIPAIYAGIAGMELMKEIGIAATREHVLELHRLLIDGLDELGAQLVTPRAADRRGA